MTQENDILLSKVTVRLRNATTQRPIGSGVIYYEHNLKDKIYILTAAHNLYADGDAFTQPLGEVSIDIYNEFSNSYAALNYKINYALALPDKDKDIAVLFLKKDDVEKITGKLPSLNVLKERLSETSFTLKGFPNATQGEELVLINPVWSQKMTTVSKFQLELKEDYNSWATGGFSGSGVFLHSSDQLYLFGIFTRFRAENKGKIIYCQYAETANEILAQNFLPLISFTYIGKDGINKDFFKNQVNTAIKNLGPRYNQKINFKLPIARLFNDISKDEFFRERFIKTIDKWILSRSYGGYTKQGENPIAEIEQELATIKTELTEWVSSIDWSAEQKIEPEPFLNRIHALNENIDEKRSTLWDLQREEEKKNPEKEDKLGYHRPYENEIDTLYTISRSNNTLFNDLEKINIQLANVPCLIIQGEGGAGKSHLLGDVSNERTKRDKPTLLLLGQLFKGGQNVWQNILAQLDLSGSKENLLNSLNRIGEQIGSRVLLLIDALNEGAGKEVWPEELAGFMAEIAKYPFIGLVVTVRSTYFNDIIPTQIQRSTDVTKVTHEGFKGNEYAALHFFCKHYGLEQPHFPILSPEFSNPLFLQLICEGLKDGGKKKFPQGFHGVSKIFRYYLNAVNAKLSKKRDEYRNKPKLAEKAIYEVAKACFEEEDSRVLPLEKAVDLFDQKFPQHRFLLDDFILENIFIKNSIHDYKTDIYYEGVFFSYERFGDFYMAERLLEPYTTKAAVKKAFRKQNELGKLVEDATWKNRGVLEALSVVLPERWNLEITEVFQWVFEGEHRDLLGNITEWLNSYLLDSLKWRTTESVDDKKLTKWLNGNQFDIDRDTYFHSLIELTILENHPFNGDRLYQILKRHTMPQRDSFWQQYLRFYSGYSDQGNAFPIRRLIDWAWQPSVSANITPETARLTAQTIAWVLSSTHIALRDQTTKAMVNLLEEQPEALVAVLKVFNDCDDLYIPERLYGVAYGCALRTSKTESLLEIAQYVFDTIFKNGNPPTHILLRDYARNIIEYALYKQLPVDGDTSLIKPPYKSKMPINIPSEDEMGIYKKDYNSPDYRQSYGDCFNQIKHSVMDWDFGRYTVDSAFRDFGPVSFTVTEDYKNFKKGLKGKKKQIVGLIETIYRMIYTLKARENTLSRSLGEERFKEEVLKQDEYAVKYIEEAKKLLSPEEYNYFDKVGKPYIESKERREVSRYGSFYTEPIKRWIVQRVFELGYNMEWHGPYESSLSGYNSRSESKIERIGKKYQWIALYEILAMVADNYKVKEETWSSTTRYKYYQGAWQGYLRDVDPIFTTRNKKTEDEIEAEIEEETLPENWWFDSRYNYWNLPLAEWTNTQQDLPDPREIIKRIDENGKEWLYLNLSFRWDEPKPFGEEKYNRRRKDIWYLIQGYLIRKTDKQRIIRWLNQQSFWGRWLPDSHRAGSSLLNRENYWSPASKENEKEVWQRLENSEFKVMVTTSQAVGELSQDKSGAHFGYDMPCKLLFEGMNLKYAPKDGEFINDKDEVVVINPDNTGILIRKDLLEEFLAKKNLDIVWTLLGEKIAMAGYLGNQDNNYFKVVNGVYFLNSGNVEGSLSLADRD